MSYNMRILPYLSPCCDVLAARFSNLTIFECSHRRDVITHTHDIFNNKCKIPPYATRKTSNLYIENKYHQLTLQKKFQLLLNKGVQHSQQNIRYNLLVLNCLINIPMAENKRLYLEFISKILLYKE